MAASTGRPEARRHKTLDERFADIADQVPGFGGFFDVGGALTVYLTDPSRADAVRAPITAFLRRAHLPEPTQVHVVRGDYDWRDLMRWYARIKSSGTVTARGAGVITTDISESRNRIVIGVLDEGSRDRVRHAIAALGDVPATAVVVEIRARPSLASSLQDYQNPDKGGERIGWEGPNGNWCTKGFNAYRVVNGAIDSASGHRYFLTAAHCTSAPYQEMGVVTGLTMGQPNTDIPIATEVADPSVFTSATSQYCDPGYACRWSDVAVFEYYGYISWKWPYVHKVCSGLTLCGDTEMQDDALDTPETYTVQKVGARTGWSSGAVVNSCEDFYEAETGVMILCSEHARLHADKGDSGSPVYRSDGIYRAAGILFAAVLDGNDAWYSPTASIQADGLSYAVSRYWRPMSW